MHATKSEKVKGTEDGLRHGDSDGVEPKAHNT